MSRYQLRLGNRDLEVRLIEKKGSRVSFEVNGEVFSVEIAAVPGSTNSSQGTSRVISQPIVKNTARTGSAGGPNVVAPMPGLIVDLKVKVGDAVKPGQTVLVMEAMKMENNIASTIAGTVKEILVKAGQEVQNGQLLVKIDG